MDENLEASSSPLLIFGGEEEEEIVFEDFYEKIEAPKFVDFTAPQRCRPDDDRYWFCVRAGCDRKHEEEIDPEAIYKNFVLRVMAARSPNVRLQRVVNRKYLSTNVKCPHTAPPNSSRTRASRLEMISSVSKKIAENRMKTKPLANATPNYKMNRPGVGGKALTTPRNKKPKAVDVGLPNNKVVAKALVFQSPKKAVRGKASQELDTPMRKICAGMEKLEIASQRKHDLGYNNPLPLDASRKKLRAREVKSRVFDWLLPQKSKGQEVKSSRFGDSVPCEDEKLMNGSLDVHASGSCKSNAGNMIAKSWAISKPREPLSDNSSEALSITFGCDETITSGSNDYEIREVPDVKESVPDGKAGVEEDKAPEVLCTDDNKENNREVMEGDDKENASAPNDNRQKELNQEHIKREIPGKHKNSKCNQKVIQVLGKTTRDTAFATSGVQVVKYRKQKTTNPKPFRLRTDERQFLKEANMERKLHNPPLKEISTIARTRKDQVKDGESHYSPEQETC